MELPIKDKAPNPAGLVPKNLQALVVVGLAMMMVIIMAVTGHKRPASATAAATSASLPGLVPVNPQKITDFQKDIEKAQRESAPHVEAALLEQQRRLASPGTQPSVLPRTAENRAPSDPIRSEQKRRAYLSLFSDNVALSYRREWRPANASSGPVPNPQASGSAMTEPDGSDPAGAQNSAVSQALSELAREGQRLHPAPPAGLALPSSSSGATPAWPATPIASGESQPASGRAQSGGGSERPGVGASHLGKEYVVFEGTSLETLLINRLDGSFAGPVNCLLSDNVYSHDRQHLLIPAGSKIVGEASKVTTLGQARLAVVFHRIIMPDGYAANLDRFKGLDQEGAAALKDKVNNHYARIFGASVAIGVLGGVAQLGSGSVLTSNSEDRIREGFGAGLANAGEHILDRFLNILPTVTIREGTRVKIYLSNDVLFPDYATHTMPSNL
jgi:type IV secretion system protein TrbI